MTSDEPLAKITILIDAGADTDDTEVNHDLYQLRSQLNDLNLDSIDGYVVEGTLDGAKADSTIHALNALEVTTAPGLLSQVVDIFRNWTSWRQDRKVVISFQYADQPLVVQALAGDLPVVLKALAEYQGLRPVVSSTIEPPSGAKGGAVSSRSGGADIAADDVTVGGDVVGRDKIMSAGGHIIIAREGATVIINDRSAEPTASLQN
jgi:hypothetical protein